MKKFGYAFDELMKWEGVDSDDPDDPGLATIYGVASKYWKQAYDEIYGLFKRNQHKDALAAAKRFYRVNFWNEFYSDLLYTPLAYKLFDLGVNMGVKRIIKKLQRVINKEYGWNWWNLIPKKIKVDGSYGRNTHNALTKFNQEVIYNLLVVRAEKFYRTRKHFWKFGRGWLRRLKNIKRLRSNVMREVELKEI